MLNASQAVIICNNCWDEGQPKILQATLTHIAVSGSRETKTVLAVWEKPVPAAEKIFTWCFTWVITFTVDWRWPFRRKCVLPEVLSRPRQTHGFKAVRVFLLHVLRAFHFWRRRVRFQPITVDLCSPLHTPIHELFVEEIWGRFLHIANRIMTFAFLFFVYSINSSCLNDFMSLFTFFTNRTRASTLSRSSWFDPPQYRSMHSCTRF